MPAVSIIVPVYNAEKYLKRCVDSLLSQTFADFELILVDDGSTDSSGAMCDAFADSDSRVMALHIKNGGPSNARNVGLNIAQGEYVIFTDSDDWVEANMLSVLVGAAKRTRAEVAVCGYFIDFVDEGYTVQKKLAAYNYIGAEEMRKGVLEMEKSGMFNLVWNKLYSRNVLDSVTFDTETVPGEDLIFNCDVFARVNCVAVVETCCVHYRKADGVSTLVNSFDINLPEQTEKFVSARAEFYKKLGLVGGEYSESFAKTTVCDYFNCIPNVFSRGRKLSSAEREKYFERLFSKAYLKEAVNSVTVSKKDINLFLFVRFFSNAKATNLVFTLLFFLKRKAYGLYKFYRKTTSN